MPALSALREARDIRWSHLLALTAFLGALLFVADIFRIAEAYGLRKLSLLVLPGFAIHALLPRALRPAFFVALSVLGLGVVLGATSGIAVVLLGLLLIALCHLPIDFRARVGLVLAVAAAAAATRVGWIETPYPEMATRVLPVLGSIFMFRMIVYLYDLPREKEPVSVWQRLGYFFLLPNVCFPLFPVVDYTTFRRTYYGRAPVQIYEKGLLWILRGVVHLLLYRAVYQYVVPDPAGVANLEGVVQYVVSSYLLYLRISGLFHLAVGILALFGFDLPETNQRYFLATSFTDFWRRINIYWKDFMLKLVYNPLMAKLRRTSLPLPYAMALATLLTLVISWLLHSFQWLWLRGAFPLRVQDAVFWCGLGLLAGINTLFEVKRRRSRSLGAQRLGWRDAATRSWKTVGTFLTMSLLWSFWTATTVAEWVQVMSVAGDADASSFLRLALAVVALILIGTLIQLAGRLGGMAAWFQSPGAVRAAAIAGVGALLAVGGGVLVLNSLGIRTGESQLASASMRLVGTLKGDQLNAQDERRLIRGYYEELIGTESWSSALWTVEMRKPADWGRIRLNGVAADTNDVRLYELLPSIRTTFKGASLSTNRWGMRDRDYERAKPPGTFRIALLGSSYTMGSGVGDDATFEALVENRLNASFGNGVSYEILNFAVPGYSLLGANLQAKKGLYDFEPDVVLIVEMAEPEVFVCRVLADAIAEGVAIENSAVQQAVQESGATPAMSEVEREKRILPFAEQLIESSYRELAAGARAHGAIPAWVYLPRTTESAEDAERGMEQAVRIPRKEGLLTLALEAYGARDEKELWVAPWDNHPNARAHAMIADRLYGEIVENAAKLGLPLARESRTNEE